MSLTGSASGQVCLLDKASGVTSRQAAMAVAKALGFRKYGHCGTLDPDATGLLVVVLGKATRLASYISGENKRYSFQLVPGILTDTLDMSGQVLEVKDASQITISDVAASLEKFTGTFLQKVPVFSAVRVDGKRGYKLARQGGVPDMPERPVTVSDWLCSSIGSNRFKLEVTVSSGTYVRALARDIGNTIGTRAVADQIRRTVAGPFSVNEASEVENCTESVLSMAEAMRDYPKVDVPDSDIEGLSHGNPVLSGVQGTAIAVNSSGDLLAVGNGDGYMFQPKVVLTDGIAK